jgi:hypothetical protein
VEQWGGGGPGHSHVEEKGGGGVRPDQQAALGRQRLRVDWCGHASDRGGEVRG